MSRRKNLAPGTKRRSGRLRLAAVVYAVVVILGLAGTGAHALWSQSGTAVSSVTTGTWGPQAVTGVKCSAEIDWRLGTDTLIVNFTAPADADQVEVSVARGLNAPTTKSVVLGSSRSDRVEFVVKNEWLSTQSLNLVVTPKYAGTAGVEVERTVTMKKDFWGTATASC